LFQQKGKHCDRFGSFCVSRKRDLRDMNICHERAFDDDDDVRFLLSSNASNSHTCCACWFFLVHPLYNNEDVRDDKYLNLMNLILKCGD
jgi:hypothetical protein